MDRLGIHSRLYNKKLKKIIYSYLLILILFFRAAFSQKVEDTEQTFMDRVQNILWIRRTFDVSSETTKPGIGFGIKL
jgi:hypothetical protein